jgi:Fe-S-cluster containining protein
MPRPLPVIESCEGCGACCRVVTLPPFRRIFDQGGEEAWERLRWDRPDLRTEFIEAERALKSSGGPTFGTPCLWLDAGSGRCLHYEYRPRACREFALGGVDCLDARRRAGV